MLVDLKRTIVCEWLNTLLVSNKTLSNVQSPLRSVFNDTCEEELIEVNPLAGWTYSRKEAQPKDDDPFSPDEQAAILGALDGQARNLVQFALCSGCVRAKWLRSTWDTLTGFVVRSSSVRQ